MLTIVFTSTSLLIIRKVDALVASDANQESQRLPSPSTGGEAEEPEESFDEDVEEDVEWGSMGHPRSFRGGSHGFYGDATIDGLWDVYGRGLRRVFSGCQEHPTGE